MYECVSVCLCVCVSMRKYPESRIDRLLLPSISLSAQGEFRLNLGEMKQTATPLSVDTQRFALLSPGVTVVARQPVELWWEAVGESFCARLPFVFPKP